MADPGSEEFNFEMFGKVPTSRGGPMTRLEAAKQLIRWGRPRASGGEVERVAPCVLTDPVYREELRRDAETLLTDPLRRVMHDIEYGSDDA